MPTSTLYADAANGIMAALPDGTFASPYEVQLGYSWFLGQANPTKCLLHFLMSGIPTGVALNPVLRLRVVNAAYLAGLSPTFSVFRLREAFVNAEATYNRRSSGNNWATAGANSSASDYYSPAEATLNLADLVDDEWIEIPLTASLTATDITNGIKLEIDEATVPDPEGGDYASVNFYRSAASGAYQPELQLTYTESGDPTATLSAVSSITSESSSAKTFVVTYADDGGAISYASIATGNCTVTGPHSYSESATLVSVDTAGDGTPRVATYSVPAPAGGWDWTANGTYTIAMVASEVCDTDTNYVEAGTLGTFTCAIAGAPSVYYYATHASTGEPFTGDVANHTVTVAYGDVTGSPWSSPREVSAANNPGWCAVDLTETQAVQPLVSVYVKSATEDCRILPVNNIPGPSWVPAATVSGTVNASITQINGTTFSGAKVPADAQAIDGDDDTPALLNRELKAALLGTVFVDGSHASSTTEFYISTNYAGDNYANMVIGFDTGDLAGSYFDISAGVVDGDYVKITLATAAASAPANGVLVSIGGNKE